MAKLDFIERTGPVVRVWVYDATDEQDAIDLAVDNMHGLEYSWTDFKGCASWEVVFESSLLH